MAQSKVNDAIQLAISDLKLSIHDAITKQALAIGDLSNVQKQMFDKISDLKDGLNKKADIDYAKEIHSQLEKLAAAVQKSEDTLSDRIIVATRPWQDETKKNTNGVNDWYRSKYKVFGGVAVIGFLWPIALIFIQKYWIN